MFWKRRKRQKATELFLENFEEKINEKDISFVFFSAPWCHACKMIKPILHDLTDENREREDFMLAMVNTDEERELSQKFSIRSLPTLVIFKGGKMVDHMPGMVPKMRLQEMINTFTER